MFRSILVLAAAGLSFAATGASAREIVLTNDDGLTSNVVAVYKALKAAGHDVVVAVPCTNQSGMSAAMRFSRPIAPLATDCLNGAAKAGAPGAGAMTRDGLGPDFFYVDGTPAMAMLYGVDVVGAKLVAALDASAKTGPLLPAGLALNVNFPDRLEGARWRLTQVGTWNAHRVRFVESLSRNATPLMRQAAQARGTSLPDQPGIALSTNEAAPTPARRDDEAVVNKTDITVSPLQAGYGAASGTEVAKRLTGLLAGTR